MYPSCTGHRTNLDEEDTLPRTEELTLASIAAFTYKELWEDYGIVADISVCSSIHHLRPILFSLHSHDSSLLKDSLGQKSTSCYLQIFSTN